ncbi:MAG: phosphotransferase family protein [Rhodospirillales bacterium]|nr:phosphotransferase family protein [Rhodospirillales bacterium]
MSVTPAERRLAESKPALQAFLAQAAGAGGASLDDARPLSGGAIQENWLIDVSFAGGPMAGRQELVLRSDAHSGVAVSLSRSQEFRLLCAARAAGVTVPEPLWLCADQSVLGRPFYVMRRVAGTAVGRHIVKDGGPGGDKTALAQRLGEELAKIHKITPPNRDLDFLEMPDGSPALSAIGHYRAHLDALGQARPALEWALRWCELNAPPAGELVLVHQDFRTGNYMVDERGLTGVLDWEFCAWGEPMSDLGWFCAKCWRFGRDDREAGGIAPREPFYQGYERVSDRQVDPGAVAYWEVMAHLRWAVIALQQGERHISGGEPSLELALTGRRVAELEHELLGMTGPARWREA